MARRGATAYAYPPGLCLGDWHISQHAEMRVPSLSITCSDSWPGLMDECEKAMRGVPRQLRLPGPPFRMRRKHEWPVVLADWQQEIVDKRPRALICGLVPSDGCRDMNWTTRVVNGGETKRYEYPRYWFTNVSDDIRQLCTDTLDSLGVEWKHRTRHGKPYNISVAHKASVAPMDAHVGPKY